MQCYFTVLLLNNTLLSSFRCKCMGGGTDAQSIVDLEEIDASKDGLALTNPAFEATDETMSEKI